MDQIIAEKLIYSYDKNKRQLDGLTFRIAAGSFVALLGRNGSGKSTLARHMNALLLPGEGRMTICGMDTADRHHHPEIRRRCGMVFQNPENQFVAPTVEEDLRFGLKNFGFPPEEYPERIREVLSRVGLSGYEHRNPQMLSGGQKQRIALAGVLVVSPDILIFDEATAMLDPQGRKEVMRTIKLLNRDYGITVILITHEMDEAAQCDRVIVIDHGSVHLDDKPEKVFSHVAEMRELGLDVPQATELADLLRQAGYPLANDILNENECVEAIAAIFKQKGILQNADS